MKTSCILIDDSSKNGKYLLVKIYTNASVFHSPLHCVAFYTYRDLSSSQTGLDRLSRARDAALCRSPTAANSHYQINLFEGFLLKADKSCYHAHPSLAKVWSWSIWNIVEIFRFSCRLCTDFIQTIFFSTFKLTLACLLFVHHIL